MIDLGAFANFLAAFGGIAAAVLVSVAAALLHRRNRSGPTLTLLGGMAILWVGSAVQLVAPRGDFSYVLDNEEMVGATGTFSTTWYIGSILFYVGLLLAATGFLMHTLSSKGRSRK
jgi:hypothetical protein